jgi:hypothetical protein
VKVAQEKCKATITQGGMYVTGDGLQSEGGESYEDGTKRVHATRVATICMDLGNKIINAENISKWFVAASDAKDTVPFDVTDMVKNSKEWDDAKAQAKTFHNTKKMGSKHHEQVMMDGFYYANGKFPLNSK